MIVTITYPDKDGSTKTFQPDIGDCNEQELLARLEPKTSDIRLKALIEKLKLPRNARRHLRVLLKFTVKVGKHVIHIGSKMLELMLLIVHTHRTMPVALLVGLVLYLILGSIPWVGCLLGPIAFLICIVLGFAESIFHAPPAVNPELEKAIRTKIAEIFSLLAPWPLPETKGQPT